MQEALRPPPSPAGTGTDCPGGCPESAMSSASKLLLSGFYDFSLWLLQHTGSSWQPEASLSIVAAHKYYHLEKSHSSGLCPNALVL